MDTRLLVDGTTLSYYMQTDAGANKDMPQVTLAELACDPRPHTVGSHSSKTL